jgi:hypothetical protein
MSSIQIFPHSTFSSMRIGVLKSLSVFFPYVFRCSLTPLASENYASGDPSGSRSNPYRDRASYSHPRPGSDLQVMNEDSCEYCRFRAFNLLLLLLFIVFSCSIKFQPLFKNSDRSRKMSSEHRAVT